MIETSGEPPTIVSGLMPARSFLSILYATLEHVKRCKEKAEISEEFCWLSQSRASAPARTRDQDRSSDAQEAASTGNLLRGKRNESPIPQQCKLPEPPM